MHAMQDLEDLYNYLFDNNSPQQADYIIAKIETTFNNLVDLPERGSYPKELISLGIQEFREIFFKNYRIIYRIIEKKIYITIIADGRRDMQTLLQERLLAQSTT